MALRRKIPVKPIFLNPPQAGDSPEGASQPQPPEFMGEVDFQTLRMRLAAAASTQPIAGAADAKGASNEDSPKAQFHHLVGIDEKADKLELIMDSPTHNNAWVRGAKGIGKTALIEGFIRARAENRLSSRLSGKPFFLFDVDAFLGQSLSVDRIAQFKTHMEYAAEHKGIVIFDHFDDMVKGSDPDFARALVSCLLTQIERKGLQAILASDDGQDKVIRDTSSGIARQFKELELNKEPTDEELRKILISYFPRLEEAHGVHFSAETADEIIRLLARYPGRAFVGSRPENAIHFANAVATYVRRNKYAEPAEVTELREKINLLQDEVAILSADGDDTKEARKGREQQIAALRIEYNKAETAGQERLLPLLKARARLDEFLTGIAVLGGKADRTPGEDARYDNYTQNLEAVKAKVLAEEKILYPKPPLVEAKHVQMVFGKEAKIPLTSLSTDQRARLSTLPAYLDTQIFLQDKAKQIVSRVYARRERGTKDPTKPTVVLFMGGTGLGKTELAKSLVRFDLGLENRPDLGVQVEPITVHLTEFQTRSSVSKITGADPGLIGYDDPIQFLEDVRKNPRGIVLFDEADKAHPALFDLLMQTFEEGKLNDSHGHTVLFKDNLIFIAMNGITASDFGPGEIGDDGKVREKVVGAVSQSSEAQGQRLFRPEFVNRVDYVVVFEPLGTPELKKILQKEIYKVNNNYRDSGIAVQVDDTTAQSILEHYEMKESGGRAPRQIVGTRILPPIDSYIEAHEEGAGSLDSGKPGMTRLQIKFDGTKVSVEPVEPQPAAAAAAGVKRAASSQLVPA